LILTINFDLSNTDSVQNTTVRHTIGFIQDTADSLNQGQQTNILATDFSKVHYRTLVYKLKYIEVNPNLTTLTKDFPHNRSQQVSVRLPVLSASP